MAIPTGCSVTVSVPTGAGQTTSGLKFNNVRVLEFDFNLQQLAVIGEQGKLHTFDLHAASTITATASSGTITFSAIS